MKEPRRRRSRIARALARAPVTPCPHCKRNTKTVSGGVCADCWAIKDPEHATVPRPKPKTWPLVDWSGWDDLSTTALLWVTAAALGILLVIAVVLR